MVVNRKSWNRIFFLPFGFLFLLLVACGGGGGDSSGGGGIAYTGATTPATVTSSNAENLALAAFNGAPLGGIVAGAQVTAEIETTGRCHSYNLASILVAALSQTDFNAPPDNDPGSAIVNTGGTLNGQCGGTATYSLSIDNVTGSFTGVFTFNAYCYNGTLISGVANYSGIYNVPASRFTTMTVTIGSLTAQDSTGTYSVSGIMAANFPSSTSYNCAMNLYLSRNGKVFWMENYGLGVTQFTGYTQMTFIGKYYHPDYGYVTVSTPTAFQVPTGAEYPSQGVMIATGANSAAARLTILSNTTYMVECDADGDGTYEWSSGTKTWP